MHVLVEGLAGAVKQVVGVDRLGDDVVGAGLHRADRGLDIGPVGQDEDGDPAAHGLDAAQDEQAVVGADTQIHYREVGAAAFDRGEEGDGVERERGLEAFEPKEQTQLFAGRRCRHREYVSADRG